MGKLLASVLLVAVLIISVNVVEQPLALGSWLAWGLDDIATHSLSEKSVPWIFEAKQMLFHRYQDLITHSDQHQAPTEVRSLTPEEYSYELVRQTTVEPLVIRGLFSDAAAIKKWSDMRYLNDTIGSVMCPVVLTDANRFEIHREAKSYQDIFNLLQDEPKSSTYVSGDQFVFESEAGKQILQDLELENHLGEAFMSSPLYSSDELYLFLGNKGNSGTSWHCAPNRSMFVQIMGRKRWTFIHPRYSLLLHPQRSHLYSRIFLASDSFQYFNNHEEKNRGRNNTIHQDGEIFAHIPRQQVVLEPGDALTVPSWYWHHVENLPKDNSDDSSLIIGVDVDTKVWNHSWLYALFPSL